MMDQNQADVPAQEQPGQDVHPSDQLGQEVIGLCTNILQGWANAFVDEATDTVMKNEELMHGLAMLVAFLLVIRYLYNAFRSGHFRDISRGEVVESVKESAQEMVEKTEDVKAKIKEEIQEGMNLRNKKFVPSPKKRD